MSNRLELNWAEATEIGPKQSNDDCLAVHLPEGERLRSRGAVALVADGMSSGQGRTAAQSCVRGFLSDYYSAPDSWTVQHAGEKVLSAINRWLYSQGQSSNMGQLGTTFSALIFKSTTAHVLHVGDSRIYRLRDGELKCLTHDHRITLRDGRSYLNRAMGVEPALAVDYREASVQRGDRFLLSTDGVHDFVDDDWIRNALSGTDDVQGLARTLIDEALDRGGNDNTSCLIVDVNEVPLATADEYFQHLTQMPFPPELEEGMKFDGFLIRQALHASNRSQLYLADDIESGTSVVLKTPSVNFEDDPVYLEQFILEEWVGRRIDNSRVLKVCPPKRKLNFLYHVVEHIDGQSLRSWIDTHSQPPIEDVTNIIGQIARGLRAFHRLDMVHRDLKPENVMLDRDGQVKIIDFGSVYVSGIDEIAAPIDRSALVGTENYTAPEYYSGYAGDSRSDLFSLGVIAYEMLTGKLPYGDKLPDRPLSGSSERPGSCRVRYQSALNHNPMIPLWMDGALEKAVRCDPERRYSLLSEFVHDLGNPNPIFMKRTVAPLIERNPVLVWKGLALSLLALNLLLLWRLFA